MAVVSLMTAAAIGGLGGVQSPPADYALAAITLAFLSGLILLLMGLFRLGFLANFLSHPVIAGFITASGLLIAASQLKHILGGVEANGHSLLAMLGGLIGDLGQTNLMTLAIGAGSAGFLFWVRKGLKPLLISAGLPPPRLADSLVKAGPVGAVVLTTLLSWGGFDLAGKGVAIVGEVPKGLPPPLTLPSFDTELWGGQLFASALLISIIGFVESVSVAQTLAAKKRQRIVPDQELVGGLGGASNVAAALSGGYPPVTGGFARSVVNFDAGGAETPPAAGGAFTAVGIALAALFLTPPLLFFLPKATLAATIIVAVLSLVDLGILKRTWAYHRADFTAVAVTIALTLGFGGSKSVCRRGGCSCPSHCSSTRPPGPPISPRLAWFPARSISVISTGMRSGRTPPNW